MTFTQLRTFALVAELGSLRAAAAELGVSEPAVSAAAGARCAPTSATRCSCGPVAASRSPPVAGRWPRTPGRSCGLADRARREVSARHLHRRGPARAGDCGLRGARGRAAARRVHRPGARARPSTSSGVTPRAWPPRWARTAATWCWACARCPAPRWSRCPSCATSGCSSPARSSALAGRRGPVTAADVLAEPWLTGPAGLEAGSAEARWAGTLPSSPRSSGTTARPTRWPPCAAAVGCCSRSRTPSATNCGAARWSGAAGGRHAGDRDLWWASVPGRGPGRRRRPARCSASSPRRTRRLR